MGGRHVEIKRQHVGNGPINSKFKTQNSTSRILVVCNTIPRVPGGGGDTRVVHLLRQLGRQGTVDFLPIPHDGYTPAQVAQFAAACPEVRLLEVAAARDLRIPARPRQPLARRIGRRLAHLRPGALPYRAAWPPAYLAGVGAVLRQVGADHAYALVQFEHSELAAWSAFLPPTLPRTLDYQDVVTAQLDTYLRLYDSWLKKLEVWIERGKFRRYERAWARRFDLCLVASPDEARRLRQIQPAARIAVVPNGVDTAYFHEGLDPETSRLVFTGSMAHGPNVDGIGFFCAEVLPRIRAVLPGVTLDIVGHSPAPAVHALAVPGAGIRVTGMVDDVRPYIWGAAVYVAPVRLGGGTRLKVLEALACGKALVATPFACEGLGLRDGEHALLRESPQALAAAVVALLRDPAARVRLGQAGREYVVAHYDWARIGAHLFAAYAQVVEKRACP